MEDDISPRKEERKKEKDGVEKRNCTREAGKNRKE